ncbi:MAG: nucleotide pyrophosphohydrolase [Bdellovibrionota bacterium]
MSDIQALVAKVQKFCEERDWDQFHPPKELAIGLITEAAELLEHFRFQSDEQITRMFDDPTKREEIEDELADCLFFILRFAGRHQIDLVKACERKIAKSAVKYPVDKARGSNRKYDQL